MTKKKETQEEYDARKKREAAEEEKYHQKLMADIAEREVWEKSLSPRQLEQLRRMEAAELGQAEKEYVDELLQATHDEAFYA